MKLPPTACLLAILALACTSFAMDVKDFHQSWDSARSAAIEQDKPIYLHFTTTWCTWCRRIEQDTYASPEGSRILQQFVPASLDCTVPPGEEPSGPTLQNIRLMQEFGGEGYPYLVMTTPDKAVLNVVSGYVPPEVFVVEMNKALQVRSEINDFPTSAPAGEDAYDFHVRALDLFTRVRLFDRAAVSAAEIRRLDPQNQRNNNARAAFVQLQALYVAPAETPAAQQEKHARAQALLAEIRQLDPENHAGVLEESLVAEVLSHLRLIDSPESAPPKLRLAISVLDDLTETAAVLKNPQQVYAFKGQLHAMLNEPQAAIAELEKALAADPGSPMARHIAQAIQQLRSAPEPPTQ